MLCRCVCKQCQQFLPVWLQCTQVPSIALKKLLSTKAYGVFTKVLILGKFSIRDAMHLLFLIVSGMGVPTVMIAPNFAVLFFSYGFGKTGVNKLIPGEFTPSKMFLAGAFSGAMYTFTICPVERIKCLLQVTKMITNSWETRDSLAAQMLYHRFNQARERYQAKLYMPDQWIVHGNYLKLVEYQVYIEGLERHLSVVRFWNCQSTCLPLL